MSEIVIAFGCQIRDVAYHTDLIAFLNKEGTSTATDVWTYPAATPSHTIRLVYTKAGFAAALDKQDAVVIYDGHSRIGQGPAFGPAKLPECPEKSKFPVNPWGDSFRMGYDLADIECIGDILHHGIDPPEYALPANTKTMFAPKAVIELLDKAITAGKAKCGSPGAWRSLKTCFPKVAAKTNCSGDATLDARHFWRAHGSGKEFDTLVAVGDADLAKTQLACSILFMNSCSSKHHYHEPLSRHKAKVKSACVFILTAEVCSAPTTLPFLKAVLAGKDVKTNRGKAILKRLNAYRGSGYISLEQ